MGDATNLKNKSGDISVLCVDDDEVIRENLGKILRNSFPRVCVAGNTKEGLAAFEAEHFDIVLVDIIMPMVNGIEMAKAIRDIDKDTAIIFLSASNETHYFLQAIDLHADGYIIKPVDVDKMLETFSKVVDTINTRMLACQYDQELENRVIFEMQKNIENTRIMLQQSRLAQIGEMITAIAHQWKEPLSVISQVVQELPDAHKYGELNIDYMNDNLKKISCQIDYMEHAIDDFSNFFKPDKSKEHFTTDELIDPVMTLLGTTLNLADIAVEINISNMSMRFFTFKNELKQVIINLINYMRHAFEKSMSGYKKIVVGIREDEDNIYLSVRHNAGSIPDTALESIFEFDFEHPETNDKDRIGLYLSKKIVTSNLGGDIVASNDKDGMIFVIRLNKED